MSTYAWIITKDLIDQDETGDRPHGISAGIRGPRGITNETAERLRLLATGEAEHTPDVHTFRMKDDDGEVYYEGLLIGDWGSEDGFGPLDDFGDGAGCTSIEYKDAFGNWEQL